MSEKKGIDYKKWEQYHQLTVDETMNLICGFEPGAYRFCGAKESEMPPHSIPIYRAMVRDFKELKITMHISGEQVNWDSICKLVHPDEFYNPYSTWWSTALLQANDIKDWLNKHNFESDFFKTSNIGKTYSPDYLNDECAEYSLKLAVAVKVWKEFFSGKEQILSGRTLKQSMEKWLEDNYKQKLSKQAIEEIAKIANWDTAGGAPKQ